jgi:molybdopterin synthase sulfur carrier subunit
MKVNLRYFAAIREALGEHAVIDVPEGTTVGELRDRLMASSADHAAALVRGHGRRCALNHVMCEESAVLTEGAELAFFPPITGG